MPDGDRKGRARVPHTIERRCTGVYVLSDDERAAIADARKGEFYIQNTTM